MAASDAEHALELAYRHLGRRDRTMAEVRGHLARRGVGDAESAHAIETLTEQGYLDDERFARRFAEDHRTLDQWGAERIERRLRELGIERDLAAGEAAAAGPDGEHHGALALLERRFPAPPETERDLNRALGLLVRRGYGLELAHDALRAFAGRRDPG